MEGAEALKDAALYITLRIKIKGSHKLGRCCYNEMKIIRSDWKKREKN
jgi:hypothetical protein